MQMLGLIELIGQLAIASSVRWYGCVFKSEDDNVLRMVLE